MRACPFIQIWSQGEPVSLFISRFHCCIQNLAKCADYQPLPNDYTILSCFPTMLLAVFLCRDIHSTVLTYHHTLQRTSDPNKFGFTLANVESDLIYLD
jgi:hypothetical protein